MRRTERAAYRTKFYSNLSSPTRFDEEPFLYSSSKKKINLETVNHSSSSASGNRWNLISSFTAIGTIDKIPTKNQ